MCYRKTRFFQKLSRTNICLLSSYSLINLSYSEYVPPYFSATPLSPVSLNESLKPKKAAEKWWNVARVSEVILPLSILTKTAHVASVNTERQCLKQSCNVITQAPTMQLTKLAMSPTCMFRLICGLFKSWQLTQKHTGLWTVKHTQTHIRLFYPLLK